MRYRFEGWELDWGNRELRCGATPIPVEPKVLQFLRIMVASPGRLLTHAELHGKLWSDVVVGRDALARIVKESRKVIKDNDREPRLLLTKRGHGYLFAGKVQVLGDESMPFRSSPSRELEPGPSSQPTGDTTALDPEGSANLFIHWLIPCRRITPVRRDEPTVLGRSTKCSEVLDGSGVSREHAVCTYQGPIAVLRDLGSRNGTHVNGRLVSEGPLVVNDVIRLGGWLGVVRRLPSPEDASFGPLAPGFHGGHEARQMLQHVRATSGVSCVFNIWGEAGSGKSALASLLHGALLAKGELVSVQCRLGAHSQDRCFGSEAIAFDGSVSTDTIRRRARAGTLLLDNVDALSHERSSALAEMIAGCDTDGPDRPNVTTTSRVAIRELAARAPAAQLALSALAGVELPIRPLRTRRSDIIELGGAFLGAFATDVSQRFSLRAVECLLLHSWPLNVQELKNTMEHWATQGGSTGPLDVHELSPVLAGLGL